jgi:iron complex transport system permease protein
MAMETKSNLLKALLLIAFCLICFGCSLMVGDIPFSQKDLFKTIFFYLRLPHTWNVFVIGCLLALSGYLSQIMLNNPLADPYTLGYSGAAGVFILLGMLLGFEGHWLILCGFIGTAISMLLLFLTAGDLRKITQARLLLAGITLAAGWGAILSLLLIATPLIQTKSFLFWLFGDPDNQQFPLFTLTSLLLGLLASTVLRKDLAVLSQGIVLAKTLGVNTEKLQLILCILSAFLTATAVTIGGTIGFIGLVVPHIARMLFKQNHFAIMMLAIIFLGGCLLLLADVLARTILAPEQLPIGIITTLLGIPCFVFLLKKDKQE